MRPTAVALLLVLGGCATVPPADPAGGSYDRWTSIRVAVPSRTGSKWTVPWLSTVEPGSLRQARTWPGTWRVTTASQDTGTPPGPVAVHLVRPFPMSRTSRMCDRMRGKFSTRLQASYTSSTGADTVIVLR